MLLVSFFFYSRQPQQAALPLIDEDVVLPGSALLPAENVDDASARTLPDFSADVLAAGQMELDKPFAHDPYSKAADGQCLCCVSVSLLCAAS